MMATTTTTTTSCSTRTRGERHHTDRSFGSSSNTRQIVVLLENDSDDDDDNNNQSTTTTSSTTLVTCTLCDPHSGAPRPYVLRKSSADLLSGALVWELHALSVSSYASYFITQSTSSSSSSLSCSVSAAPKDRVVGGRTGRPPRAPLLYVATRVDPLFFLLARHEPPPSREDTATVTNPTPSSSSSSSSSLLLPRRSWQPWDQIRREYQDSYSDSNHNNKNNDDPWSSSISLAYQLVDEKQLQGHFYKRYHVNTNNDHNNNNNETFYQFCPTKALRWLTRKQDAVLAQWWKSVPPRPETKDHPQRQAVPATTISPGQAGGSHESTAITNTVTTTVTPSCDTSSAAPYEWAPHATTADREAAREESIQIVASYLNAAWRKCFYHHVNAVACSSLVDDDDDNNEKEKDNRLLPSPSRQTSLATAMTSTRDHLEYYTTGNMSLNMVTASQHARSSSNSRCRHGEPEAKKIKTSAAAKQLEKVNTKGMKKMSAFFTVKKK